MIHKELFELIKDLNPVELDLINRTIINSSNNETKEIRLFNFLLNQPILPELKEVSKAVYKKSNPPSYDSFKKLVYRSQKKVFEVVLFCNDSFVNFQGESNLMEKDLDIISVVILRKAIVIQSFINNRSPRFINYLLDDIIKQSLQFELYYLAVEYLNIKLSLCNANDGITAFNKIKKQIIFYEYCRDAVRIAGDNYIKFTVFNNFYPIKAELEQELIGQIKVLKENFIKSKSHLIKYYLLFYEMNLHLINDDYDIVRAKSDEIIKYISLSNIESLKDKLLTVNAYYIKAEIHLGNYLNALDLLKESKQNLKKGTRNYLIYTEYEFLCNTYLKRYKEAEKALNAILEDTTGYNSFEMVKLNIYKANLNFVNCQYKEVIDLLYQRNEIMKDITGWEYSRRVLQLFVNLFRGREDEVIRDFECLKKQVKRNFGGNKEYSCRDKIILKIMGHICKKDYILDSEDNKLNNLLRSLNQFPWQAFSAELIPIEEIINQLFLKSDSIYKQELTYSNKQ
ncbi:MAG: hypothetical protein M3Q58_12600 [Bacteroidota bacterium]|nr:hypothetical protein [Bacteroidota bacterium]